MAAIVIGGMAMLAVAGSGEVARAADDAKDAGKPPPKVLVAEVVERAVPVDRVYTGTTAAVKAIELRAQVTGYLLERNFTEGSTVATGEKLYVIDPRPFQAVLDQRQAQLQEQEAVLKYAKTTQNRYATAARAGAAARQTLDQAIELEAKTEASIDVFKAEIEQATINLDFTRIQAPFDGRVGRTLVNIGALVKANDTALAAFVQLDPIYVYFSPPETELLLIEDHPAKAPRAVTVTLPHATAESFKGTLTFISNTADARTGTIAMRATVSNPNQRIRPGQFALVRLRIAEDRNALVVPAKSVSSLQGQRFVMVVGKDDKLENRKVDLGRQVGTGGYVVETGLTKGERVVVSDTRTLKIGETVSPQREPAS
jgi:RND family efflux transporter MFP subunit